MQSRIGSWKPFPVDSLPEPLAGFVKAASKALGCAASYVALPLLAALASAIGATVRIELKSGWTEPAVIWAAIVGESGTLKSPAHNVAVGPLKRLQTIAMSEYPESLRVHKRDLALFEADMAAWKRAGRKKGEPPPEKPEEPQPKRYLCDDITIEALADRLQHSPRGLLCAADELAGWLGSFGQYKNSGQRSGDVSRWLSIFRAESILVDRKTGAIKTVFVPRAAVSVCGSIQPEILRRCLGVEYLANGLAARLLLAMPPRAAKTWTNATVAPSLKKDIDCVFGRLLALGFHEAEDGQLQPITLPLSPDGKRAWVEFYNAHAREQAGLTGPLAAVSAKLEAYAARFALVFHLVRLVAEDPTLPDTEEIDGESVTAGVSLVHWFADEARRVYSVFSESEEDEARRQLVEMIQRHGGEMTARELQRAQHLETAGQAEAALGKLVKAGLGEWVIVQHDGPGRPAPTFRLVSQDCDRIRVSSGGNGNCVTKLPADADEINRAFDEVAEEIVEGT